MKKYILIILGLIFVGVLVIVGFYYFSPKEEVSNYSLLIEAGNQNYDVDLSLVYNDTEIDAHAYYGEYSYSNNSIIYTEDEEFEVKDNLYSVIAKKLGNRNYEDGEYTYTVTFDDVASLDPFYKNLFETTSLTYICTFDISENKVYNIDCLNDNSNFIVDFYFDD